MIGNQIVLDDKQDTNDASTNHHLLKKDQGKSRMNHRNQNNPTFILLAVLHRRV